MSPRAATALHRGCNLACAATFVHTAQLQVAEIATADPFVPSLLLIACVALAAAMLLRPAARRLDCRARVLAVVVISNLYYLLFDLTTPAADARAGIGAVIIGAGVASWCGSALWLGRSFSIVPALRDIRTTGPYAIVRHPVYASYLIIDAGIVVSFPSWWNAALAVAALGFYVMRARAEEDLLSTTDAYEHYRARVPHRFVPLVY